MMHQRFTHLQVGDTVQPDRSHRMQGDEMLRASNGMPVVFWFALQTPPQKERAARYHLRRHGQDAFYPSEMRQWKVRGQWREREAPIVPGYVYARFTHQPQWHVIKALPFFSGVIAIGVHPFPIPRAIVRRLRGMTVEAEELARAKAEVRSAMAAAYAPAEGEPATITSGPLAGFCVDIRSIRGGVAHFMFQSGKPGSADVGSLRRDGVDLSSIPGYLDATAHREGNG